LYPGIGQILDHSKSLGFYNLLLTTNGSLLKQKYKEVSPFINSVRFSIHGMNSKHDEIVGHPGAFDETAHAIDFLIASNIPCFVTTVVTTLNVSDINNIAEWSFSKGVTSYYLFALMKSGSGKRFIESNGEVAPEQINKIHSELKTKYSSNGMDIVYYDYTNNAECILIYGDGKIVIDPYPKSTTFQLEIGNIFTDTQEKIIERFLKDKENLNGHRLHINKHNKKFM
jgi:MoaA/NifB/PqqE/SkfB family radical SAM enzyme